MNTIAQSPFRALQRDRWVLMSDRQVVVDELRQGFNEVRCAFSSDPEREWNLD